MKDLTGNYIVKSNFSLLPFIDKIYELNSKASGENFFTIVGAEDWNGSRTFDHESSENTRHDKLSFSKNQEISLKYTNSNISDYDAFIIEKKLSCCEAHNTQIWISKDLLPLLEPYFEAYFVII